MVRIDAPGLQPGLNTQARTGEGTAQPGNGQVGVFRGEQIRVLDETVVSLADNAEEMSLFHAEKAEEKDFEERVLEGEQHAELMRLEEIKAHLEATKAFSDPKKLAEIVKQMLKGESSPGGIAKQQSKNPTQQHLLLQYALHEGLKSGAPAEVMDQIRDALADLEMEHGPQIRAGLNSLEAAAEWAGDADGVEAFQSTYQDVVLGGGSLSHTLGLVLERLGGASGDDFVRGLNGLIRALGADLAAARPSTEPNRLRSLVQDLYQLNVTATILDGAKALAETLKTEHRAPGVDGVQLTRDLVVITGEKWASASRFASLASGFGLRAPEAQIAFQTGVRGLLREMPTQVFADMDTRQSMLAAQQEALDAAIDLEDA